MEEKRINLILNHELFKECLKENERWEKHRIFCSHNLEHFLDVARIAYIMSLEKSLNYKKDVIYAAALLHDIGRWKQYKEGIPHELASIEISKTILKYAGYNEEEKKDIEHAITCHRDNTEEEYSLASIIYRSDKLSRNCFNCAAIKQCNWSEHLKNNSIVY